LQGFASKARNKLKIIFAGNRVFGKNTSQPTGVRAKRVRRWRLRALSLEIRGF
jgi:hypothetical protein